MSMSSHIIPEKKLAYRKDDEYLLSTFVRFKDCTDFEENDVDGNYIVYDRIRRVYFSSGMVYVGMIHR